MNNSNNGSFSRSGLTPLLRESFSGLRDARRSSLYSPADSGYDSSICDVSLTPAGSETAAGRQSSSTPLFSILPQRTRAHLFPETPRFSEDRIPRPAVTRTSSTSADDDSDLLSMLMRRDVAVRQILSYLPDADLFTLCQVSDTYCSLVYSDRSCLHRLASFLRKEKCSVENRTTPHRTLLDPAARRRSEGILRSIENLPRTPSTPSYTVPSVLENINLRMIPFRLRSLIELSTDLGELDVVQVCRSCPRLVVVARAVGETPRGAASECTKCRARSQPRSGTARKLRSRFTVGYR